MNFRIKEKLIYGFKGVKKIFFNARSWKKDDISIVFTKLAYFKKRER